jgi:hypothetical protein
MFTPKLDEKENRGSKKRLVVLVPDGLVETAKFARQVRWLALQQQRDVIFLAIAARQDTMSASRLLATVEAITRDAMLRVESLQIETGSWVKAVKSVYRVGDLVVCHEGQRVAKGLGKKIPLEQLLSKDLRLPTSVLTGFYEGETISLQPILKSLIFWIGSILIVAGFSLIEYRVDHLMSGAIRIVILSILIIFASGLIYQLNKFTD